jgi:hypothetical protein
MGEVKLSLQPGLQQELVYAAEMVGADIPTLLDQAVREYLDRLAEQKIIAESEAFRAMHAELLQQYRGEYVAVHNGKVVDHDEDVCALNRRIRARYGRQAVLLQQVTERPEVELVIQSPKLEQITQVRR